MIYFVSMVHCVTLKLIAVDNKEFSLNLLTQNNLFDIEVIEIANNTRFTAGIIKSAFLSGNGF